MSTDHEIPYGACHICGHLRNEHQPGAGWCPADGPDGWGTTTYEPEGMTFAVPEPVRQSPITSKPLRLATHDSSTWRDSLHVDERKFLDNAESLGEGMDWLETKSALGRLAMIRRAYRDVETKLTTAERERDELRGLLAEIAAETRPKHEHYDDPGECALCRSYILLGLETKEEQRRGY